MDIGRFFNIDISTFFDGFPHHRPLTSPLCEIHNLYRIEKPWNSRCVAQACSYDEAVIIDPFRVVRPEALPRGEDSNPLPPYWIIYSPLPSMSVGRENQIHRVRDESVMLGVMSEEDGIAFWGTI